MKFIVLVVVSVLVACAPGADGPALTRLTEIVSSAKCRTGGVRISTGRDWNRDGVLADDEVTESSEVCNGATPASGLNGADGRNGADGAAGRDGADGHDGMNGANGVNAPTPLVRTTMLAGGDASCPSGGVRIEIGLDHLLDGGLGDGVLDASEIQSTRVLCNGTVPVYPRPTAPPEGDAGTYVLNASGGSGQRSGASAGAITILLANGSLGGNVKVFSTGQVDAGFAWPSVTFEPGLRPMRVTADVAVKLYGSVAAGLQSGDAYYSLPQSGVIYARVGNAAEVVTSIDVEAGASLLLSPAMGQVRVKSDIRNAGLIRGHEFGQPVELSASAFWGLRESLVSGASVSVQAHRIVNGGSIDARGGRVMLSGYQCLNAGLLDVSGTNGAAGGIIEMTCSELFNRGAMRANGSDGTSGSGKGGTFSLKSFGDLVNAGELSARAGACSGANCVAGMGGAIRLLAAGDLRLNARLTASGGRADSGTAGNGGAIEVVVQPTAVPRAVGSLSVSGSMSVSGGEGFAGGQGGWMVIGLDPSFAPRGQEVELLGYSDLLAVGGSGQWFGGTGGFVSIKAAASTRGGSVIGPTGATVVTAQRIDVHGGSASSSGRGGLVSLGSHLGEVGAPGEFTLNLAALNGKGGSGRHIGGVGGSVELYSAGSIENRGEVRLRGGDGIGELAGLGGTLSMLASVKVSNSGLLEVSGGDSFVELGGNGGRVMMAAGQVTNSGAMLSNGGVSDEGLGGDGGPITLFSYQGVTKNTGIIETTPGPGTLGKPGVVMFDGIKQ